MLILGSILLGCAAAYTLRVLGVEWKRAVLIGLLVAAGAFCVGWAIREALMPNV
jgi:hypothetical protein